MLNEKIKTIKRELVGYATHVESMIDKSIKGLLQKKSKVLEDVIDKDEPISNDFELKLEELCTNTLAQFQPMAKDLRLILMILKIVNDLERIGDHAVNIADGSLFLIDKAPVKPLIDIPRMAEGTINMLKDSIDSFINEDAKLAVDVLGRDNFIDSLHTQILRELITYMSADPSTIERALQLIRIAKNLERIADLATNICEDVIYIAKGKIVKHHHTEFFTKKNLAED
jgi:phosphate transport system protein